MRETQYFEGQWPAQSKSSGPSSYEQEKQVSCSGDSRQQFSFNRQQRKNNEHYLRQKYSQIYHDLQVMKNQDVIDLLLEELQENEKFKLQICNHTNRIRVLEDELSELREQVRKKSDTITTLCEKEQKNLQLIEKLQSKMHNKNELGRDTHYEKKYQQLCVYMNEYIRNINLAQEQFKKAYSSVKNENTRFHQQMEQCNGEYSRMTKKMQILTQKLKRNEDEIQKLHEQVKRTNVTMSMINEQNSNLRKQIQVYQENIRITDRLQIHFSQQHNQISSDLDFIREKICENHNISKDIIQKLEESSAHCDKINKAKDLALASLQKNQQKNTQLEGEICSLKKVIEGLEEELQLCKKQLECALQEKDYVDVDLSQEKIEKQSIRKQLMNLAEQVKFMEFTYRREIEQSEKIKEELFNFWQKKEKKEGLLRNMSSNGFGQKRSNDCDYFQSTFIISEKQRKMSWKRTDQQSTFNLQDKQNIEEHSSQDSLCT